jgi:hypothetical protein
MSVRVTGYVHMEGEGLDEVDRPVQQNATIKCLAPVTRHIRRLTSDRFHSFHPDDMVI